MHTSCSGCHCVVLDVDGVAWMFGRNDKSCLGVTDVDAISENEPRRLAPQDLGAPKGTRFVHAACGRNHTLLVGSGGEVWSAGANHAGQVSPRTLDAANILPTLQSLCFIVWPSRMPGNPVVQAGARSQGRRREGASGKGCGRHYLFSGAHQERQGCVVFRSWQDVLLNARAVFAFGSEEKGQLGSGSAGERIVSAGKSAFDYETEPSQYYHSFSCL